MKFYIVSSLSLNMLSLEKDWTLEIIAVHNDSAVGLWLALAESRGFNIISAIGHEDTAGILEKRFLGSKLQSYYPLFRGRQDIDLKPGDELLVFQYKGPRLPERATKLPNGATLTPVLVRVRC